MHLLQVDKIKIAIKVTLHWIKAGIDQIHHFLSALQFMNQKAHMDIILKINFKEQVEIILKINLPAKIN